MRLRGTTASELEEIGEETDGLVEDASKLYEIVKELTKTQSNPEGISIIDKTTNAYKSTYEILLEISEIYEELDDMNKAALLESLAGKTRGSVVAAILQSGEILKSAYNDALNNVSGAGEEAMLASMDSIEKKAIQFKNQIQKLAQDFINAKSVKSIVDMGTSIISFIDKLVSKTGSLTSLSAVLTSVFSATKNFGAQTSQLWVNKKIVLKAEDYMYLSGNTSFSYN